MTDAENKKTLKAVKDYLMGQCGNKITDKILDMIAKKLGVSSYLSLIKMEFPGKKLADFTVGMLKVMYFEGYFSLYANNDWNPYNPQKSDQQEPYAEYLIYSWARGNPGYKYWYTGF